jgi:hypothetical protein
MHGLTHLQVQLNRCIENAREIAKEGQLRVQHYVRDILSAGFCALGRALGDHGSIADELMMMSKDYRSVPETIRNYQEEGRIQNARLDSCFGAWPFGQVLWFEWKCRRMEGGCPRITDQLRRPTEQPESGGIGGETEEPPPPYGSWEGKLSQDGVEFGSPR